jgi:hypothetical protein
VKRTIRHNEAAGQVFLYLADAKVTEATKHPSAGRRRKVTFIVSPKLQRKRGLIGK